MRSDHRSWPPGRSPIRYRYPWKIWRSSIHSADLLAVCRIQDKVWLPFGIHFCLKCTFSNSILPHRLNAVFCTGFLLVEFTCQDDLAIGRFKIEQELPIF